MKRRQIRWDGISVRIIHAPIFFFQIILLVSSFFSLRFIMYTPVYVLSVSGVWLPFFSLCFSGSAGGTAVHASDLPHRRRNVFDHAYDYNSALQLSSGIFPTFPEISSRSENYSHVPRNFSDSENFPRSENFPYVPFITALPSRKRITCN